jgi:ketosteroid isomerase-like protein
MALQIERITMADPNALLITEAYDAFARGDIQTVLQTLADDVTWHVPGRSPLSGDHKGHDGVLTFFGRCQELSGGTLRVAADQVFAAGDRVVVLSTVSAERKGQFWSAPEVHVWRVIDGRATEFREFQGDQQTEDEFWAS